MAEMCLTTSFALAKAAVQKPGGVDQPWLFAEPASIGLVGCCDGVVGVGLEAQYLAEQGRVDI